MEIRISDDYLAISTSIVGLLKVVAILNLVNSVR